MNLRELCEPLFLYVCRLNRSARKGGTVEYKAARAEIEGILRDMKSQADEDAGLVAEFTKIELPLIFFVDSVISESRLPFAGEWHQNRLAYGRDELAGDEKFFDVLDATLEEQGEAADDRLAVLYTCVGLGFTGWYAGQPEYLRKKMLECSARLRDVMETDERAYLCHAAYDALDTRDLIQPPAAKLGGIAIGVVGLIVVLLIANVVAYRWSSSELDRHIEAITDPTAAEVSP